MYFVVSGAHPKRRGCTCKSCKIPLRQTQPWHSQTSSPKSCSISGKFCLWCASFKPILLLLTVTVKNNLLAWINRLWKYLFQHQATIYFLLKAPYRLNRIGVDNTNFFIVNITPHSLIVRFTRWMWSSLCNRAQHFMHIMTLSLQKMTGRAYGCCVIVLKSKTQWKLVVSVLALSLFFIWQVSLLNCYVLRP